MKQRVTAMAMLGQTVKDNLKNKKVKNYSIVKRKIGEITHTVTWT